MTEYSRRMSARMNTLLMKARIFDEDSSERSTQVKTSKEPLNSILSKNEMKIKEEHEDVKPDINSKRKRPTLCPKVKIEKEYVEVKHEDEQTDFSMEEESLFPCNVFNKLNLSKETMEQYLSPVKLEIDNNIDDSLDSKSRKSAKRTVFPRESPYKSRESPYKTKESPYKTRESPYKTRQSPYKKPSLEPSMSTSLYTKREGSDRYKMRKRISPIELETDPEILKRRQKQIDYGKNTIGYDIYSTTVPKSERSQTDPQTPNKFGKYSRRGFDGLIKQWRLKLHKYDPPDEDEIKEDE